jgi:hypothetical protein
MQILLQEASMKFAIQNIRHLFAAAFLTLTLFAAAAVAGPPLICHPFDIGDAKSLPWVSHSWNLSGSENYDTSKLASDTIAILDASQITLVHMETLRRATLYARQSPLAAKQLLTRLVARSQAADASPLTIFDAGYLAETYKQWLGEQSNPAKGVDGYNMVLKALAQRSSGPQMEFAAALIAVSNPSLDARDHAQKAIAGAKTDVLLARNLSARFLGAQSQTLSAMITRSKVGKPQ